MSVTSIILPVESFKLEVSTCRQRCGWSHFQATLNDRICNKSEI